MNNNVGFSSLSGKVIRKDYDKTLNQSILNDTTSTNQEKRAVLNKLPVPPPPPKRGGRRSKRRTSKNNKNEQKNANTIKKQ